MLRLDWQWQYIVWPSWAKSFTTTWDELTQLLGGPVPAEFIDCNDQKLIQSGRVQNEAIPVEVFPGAFGNGVFRRKATPGQYWLGHNLFRDEATFLNVPSMGVAKEPESGLFWSNVAFVTLRSDVGLKRMGTGWKKPREYPCAATFEHVEAVGDSVYWLLDQSPGKRPPPGLEALLAGATAFGLHIEPVEQVDSEISREVKAWFTDESKMEWYRVQGGPQESGWQLAVMFYCLLHLKQLAGARLDCGHLVAQIEKRPHLRINWGRR